MFSGIIDHCGTIIELNQRSNSLSALIECEFTDVTEGESIAVDGICLTAIQPSPKHFRCDISPETLRLTTAQEFTIGRKVNLERALCMGDRVSGHWVMGHIDQCARIQTINNQQEFIEMQITGLTKKTMPYLLKKGSIAVNGVSLTINEVTTDIFQVMLIPHTLERTNLGYLKPNNLVNIEFDWMARVIVNQLRQLEISAK